MKLYLDTSGLVKLWIDEEHSVRVRTMVAAASELGTSTVAYAELGATLARLERERRLSSKARELILEDFAARWMGMRRVVAGPMISRRGASLARVHALRGFDAIHLASALQLRLSMGDLIFVGFDQRLNAGAASEGFGLF